MKRCWFGLGLLGVLLGLSIFVTWRMDKTHTPMAENIAQAEERALNGDWGNAESLAGKAKAQWEEGWGISASFADHEPMEDIDALFAQLDTYAKAKNSLGFAVTCAHLRSSLEAMGDAHGFLWWNLL